VNLLYRGSVLPLFFALVMLKGTGELIRLLRAAGIFPYASLAYLGVAAIFLAPWLSAGGCWARTCNRRGAAVAGGPSGVHSHGRAGRNSCAGHRLVYQELLGHHAARHLPGVSAVFCHAASVWTDSPGQRGVWLLLTSILVAKGSDIGAYFVGPARVGTS